MLGPEASLNAKLRFETGVLELSELETTKDFVVHREEPDPFNFTQSEATFVNATFDRRTRLRTKHSCDDNTSIMVNAIQRLFIGIFVHKNNPFDK